MSSVQGCVCMYLKIAKIFHSQVHQKAVNYINAAELWNKQLNVFGPTMSNMRSCAPNGLVFRVDIIPNKTGRIENLTNTPKDNKSEKASCGI